MATNVLGLVIVKPDDADELVELGWFDGEDVLEGQSRAGPWRVRRQLVVQAAHGGGVDGVFGLAGQHQGDEDVETLVAVACGWVEEAVAAHGIDGRVAGGTAEPHLPDQGVHFLPVGGGFNFGGGGRRWTPDDAGGLSALARCRGRRRRRRPSFILLLVGGGGKGSGDLFGLGSSASLPWADTVFDVEERRLF